MKINKVACIWFSPTHGSERVARAVAEGLAEGAACTMETLDATCAPLPARSFGADVAAVVAVPVYGDAAAPIALERLAALRAERAPALAVVTYGNRSFGHAAHDLARALAAQGFDVVGAGAFVGEHSYSSPATPIAPGRPDAADLAQARSWGDNEEEKNLFEHDATTLVTIWGGDGDPLIFDYSWREWAGLIGGYYLPRWEKFYAMLQHCLDTDTPYREDGLKLTHGREAFRANDFYNGLGDWELQYTQTYGKARTLITEGDEVETASRLYRKYLQLAGEYYGEETGADKLVETYNFENLGEKR